MKKLLSVLFQVYLFGACPLAMLVMIAFWMNAIASTSSNAECYGHPAYMTAEEEQRCFHQ